jgi:hypothetical protein
MRVGAIFFDSNNKLVANDRTAVLLNSAWASISGEQAQRVRSIHNLPSDVLWFTNLTYNNFYRAGLQRHPNFRNEGWLRTLFNQLVAELGVDLNSVSPDITVSTIAAIAQRTVSVAKSRYEVHPKSKRLNEDFAIAMSAPRSALPDKFYNYFDTVADHPSVSVIYTTNYGAGLPTVTVRRNRLHHAREVLATPVPTDTGWEMEKAVAPDHNDKWLENINTPFLVKCTVSNVNPMIAEVLSWGSGSRDVREWLTDIEWRVVRQYADVSVSAALICNNPAAPLPQAKLLPEGPLDKLSFTYGLIAEQIWTAMTNKQHYKGGMNRYTAAAAWLRAADRMAMFDYAQKLYRSGLNVMSYGVGNVVLRYPENELRHTLDIATDIGLMPPASKLAEAAAWRG